jgi:hypothetical protein
MLLGTLSLLIMMKKSVSVCIDLFVTQFLLEVKLAHLDETLAIFVFCKI